MSARYNPRKEHSLKRSYGFRIPKKSFLIVCEGENTEPEYFNAFRLTSATVKAVGKGLGTMSLVKEALAIRKTEKVKGKTFPSSHFAQNPIPNRTIRQIIYILYLFCRHKEYPKAQISPQIQSSFLFPLSQQRNKEKRCRAMPDT